MSDFTPSSSNSSASTSSSPGETGNGKVWSCLLYQSRAICYLANLTSEESKVQKAALTADSRPHHPRRTGCLEFFGGWHRCMPSRIGVRDRLDAACLNHKRVSERTTAIIIDGKKGDCDCWADEPQLSKKRVKTEPPRDPQQSGTVWTSL